MPQHTGSDEFHHRASQVRVIAEGLFDQTERSEGTVVDWAYSSSVVSRTIFDLYQEAIARGILAYAMDDADKYRLVARSLRERAIAPEMAFQRKEVIGLAARFEVLAIEADYIQEHLVDMLFAPRPVRSSLRNLPL
jgi:hypothetical protein